MADATEDSDAVEQTGTVTFILCYLLLFPSRSFVFEFSFVYIVYVFVYILNNGVYFRIFVLGLGATP